LFQTCWNDSLDNYREEQYEVVGVRSVLSSSLTRSELAERTGRPKGLLRRIQPFLEAIPGLERSHLFALVRNLARNQEERTFWRLELDEPEGVVRSKVRRASVAQFLHEADGLFLALVEHSLALCHQRGWPTALMSVRMGDTRFASLRQLCERFDTPLLDIRNREAHPELYYEVDSHWNQAGHREVARLILERVLTPDSQYLSGLTPIR